MTQAGLYKLKLYENKQFSFLYNSEGIIDLDSISNSGDILEFETNDNRNKYANEIPSAYNNDIINNHKIELWINGLIQSNLDTLEKLQYSIYGWIPVMEFMDNQKYLINAPFFISVGPFNSQITHTFKLELKSRVSTYKKLQEVSVSESVTGVLDYDGIDDKVDFSSDIDVTGNKVATFECRFADILGTTPSNQSLWIYLVAGTSDFLLIGLDIQVSSLLIGVTCGGTLVPNAAKSYELPLSRKGENLEVQLTKSVGEPTELLVNGDEISPATTQNGQNVPNGMHVGTLANIYYSKSNESAWVWNLNVNNDHRYAMQPNGNLDSAYVDTGNIGGINGTVSGNPTTKDF